MKKLFTALILCFFVTATQASNIIPAPGGTGTSVETKNINCGSGQVSASSYTFVGVYPMPRNGTMTGLGTFVIDESSACITSWSVWHSTWGQDTSLLGWDKVYGSYIINGNKSSGIQAVNYAYDAGSIFGVTVDTLTQPSLAPSGLNLMMRFISSSSYIPQPPPATPLLLAPLSGFTTNQNTLVYTWFGTNIDSYQMKATDSYGVTTTSAVTLSQAMLSLNQGTYGWTVRGVYNGNYTAWASSYTLIIDTTAPPAVTSLTSPANGLSTTTTNIGFSWGRVSDDLSGLADYIVKVSTNNFSTVAFSSATLLTTANITCAASVSTYTWRVDTQDNAGNYTTATASRTFVVSSMDVGWDHGMPITYPGVSYIARYDENTGTSFADATGKNPNGVCGGAWVKTHYGYGQDPQGIDGHGGVITSPNLFNTAFSSFSIVMRLNFASWDTSKYYYLFLDLPKEYIIFRIVPGGVFQMYGNSPSLYATTTITIPVDSNMHTLGVSYDASNCYFYLDSQEQTISAPGSYPYSGASTNCGLLNNPATGEYAFCNKVDEYAIFIGKCIYPSEFSSMHSSYQSGAGY